MYVGISLILFFSILILISIPSNANFYFKIYGLTGELKKNIHIQLSNIAQNKVITDSNFRTIVENAIRLELRSLGYYEPVIKFLYKKNQLSSNPIIIVTVDIGKPVRVKDIKITLKGSGKYDENYITILTNSALQKGTILNHRNYENLKHKFIQIAIRNGYFDAKMEKSQLEISLSNHASYWRFNFNSGQRYRFGFVKYQGSQIRKDYLNNIITFKHGDYYISDQLVKLHHQLVNTGWFKSVIIRPNIDKAHQEKSYYLPINIIFIPQKQNHIELGIGYSTDVGTRIKTILDKPWINSKGQSLTSSFIFSQSEKIYNANYRIPLQKNPLEQYYIIQLWIKRSNLNYINYNTVVLNILRYWNYYEGWKYGINLRYSVNHSIQENIVNRTMLLYSNVTINRVRQQDNTLLHWSDNQQYTIDVSNTIWGSDINFIILQAQNIWIRTPWERHRFIIRGNLGWIKTNQFNKIPLDLRFFAGGNRSIRGYGYQKISSIDNKGRLIGASKLIVGSFEYQYNIINNAWIAVFIDSGDAANNFNRNNFKVGTGIGLRWSLPVGTVKLDVAAPMINHDYSKVQIHIGLGTEL